MCMCCQTPPAHKSNFKYLKLAYKFLFKNLCGSIYHRTTYFFDLGYLVSFWFFAYQLKLYLEMLHWIKLREYGLSRTHILLYKFRIYKSAFMQENTGQWKTVLLLILCSVSWKVCLIFRMVLLIKVLISWSVVSVFGVFLVRIFPHSDWIRRDTRYLSVFGKIRTR